jgi:hypothetical protein
MQLSGVNSAGMRVEQHVFVLDHFQVGLGILWPDGKQRPRTAERFFASFKILDKGTWDLPPDAPQSPWRRHAPAEATFAVEVPGVASVSSIGSGKDAGVALVSTDGVGDVYRVIEMPRPPKSRCQEDSLVRPLGIEVQERKRAKVAGGDGLLVRGRRKGMVAEARIACTEHQIFIAMVTSPPRRPGHADPGRFFDSLAVVPPPKK